MIIGSLGGDILTLLLPLQEAQALSGKIVSAARAITSDNIPNPLEGLWAVPANEVKTILISSCREEPVW